MMESQLTAAIDKDSSENMKFSTAIFLALPMVAVAIPNPQLTPPSTECLTQLLCCSELVVSITLSKWRCIPLNGRL